MKQSIWCKLFGLHTYEVMEEKDLVDAKDNVIGTIYVQRCTICGKLKQVVVRTERYE